MDIDLPGFIVSYIELKRQGDSWVGRCPFHEDRDPSFRVFDGHFHCFGCSAHGNAVDFVQRLTGTSRLRAKTYVDKQPVSRAPRLRQPMQTQPSSRILEQQLITYRAGLAKSSNYLISRSVRPETAKSFELGATSQRLMIPVRDADGELVGFTGRAIGHIEPKYMNSPGLPLSRILYGLHLLPKAREIYLVEGYFDVITLQQANLPAVATGRRVEFTRAQIELLKGRQVIIAPDGDVSGREGGSRGFSQLTEAGVDTRLLHLPDGEDPDSLVRSQGRGALERLVKS